MNKFAFKHKIKHFIRLAETYHGHINLEHAYKVLAGAASRCASVNLETFSTVVFGYTIGQFTDPKTTCPKLREDAYKLMSSNGTHKVDDFMFRSACSIVRIQLGLNNVYFNPATPLTAIHSLPGNTSTGAWFFKRPKSEYAAIVVDMMQDVINNTSSKLKYVTSSCLTYISWRTQERQSGTKFRQIYVMPYIWNGFEAMFAHPMFCHFKENRHTSYCFDNVFTDNIEIWNDLQSYKYIYSIDYTQFDLNTSQAMLFIGLKFIKSLFILTKPMSDLFDAIISIHIGSNVVTSLNGKPFIFTKKAGLFSGSVFTNVLGSIINLIIINYCLLMQDIDPLTCYIKVKGDDLIIGSNVPIDTDDFIFISSKSFGSVIKKENVLKYTKGDPIFFLGYTISPNNKLPSSIELLHRKIAVSGRFITEDEMPEHVRVLSKIVSVLSNVSIGKEIFYRDYHSQYLQFYKHKISSLPEYYFDLTERENKPYVLDDKRSVQHELEIGWQYK